MSKIRGERSEKMDVNVDEQAIVDKLYESTKDWVSVEVELNKTMKPSVLFHLTEKDAGDRFTCA